MRLNFEKHGITIPDKYFGKTGNIKIPCPFCGETRHNHNDPSLSVNMTTGLYHCHHCNKSGCAAEQDENVKTEWQQKRKDYKRPTPTGSATLSLEMLGYFLRRGISHETLIDMRVSQATQPMPPDWQQKVTIQFNYYHCGELINIKSRSLDKCFRLVTDAELIPYNIDAIFGEKTAIITEGEMDALTFHECGYSNVVSVPNGANANLQYLDNYLADYFDDKETIYIASDTDSKGVLLRDELVRRFGADRCKIVTYGDDCKDANELLMKHGKDAVKNAIERANEVKVDGIFSLADVEPGLDIIWKKGLQKGLGLGYENFDALCTFETKRLCVVTGIPGSGKSEFLDQIAERLNIRYGWKWAFFSPENHPIELHISKFMEKFTGRTFGLATLGQLEYDQAKRYIDDNIFFIAPPDGFTIDNILDKAKYLVRRKGVKGIVIDPYNEIEHQIPSGMSETNYISMLLGKLKNFAKINDVLIFLMAHPTKLRKAENGQPEVPNLYDISGSANFYNKTDFGLVVHRNYMEQFTEVRVEKVKFRHLGSKGSCKFKFNSINGRYEPFYDLGDPLWDNTNHIADQQRDQQRQQQFENFFSTDNNGDCPF